MTGKIVLSPSRDIPFNKLVLSQANVRHVKTGVSIEQLAEDIARRGLLQSLSVRAVVDAAGAETGIFEVPAGGRRYRALESLVKQKHMAKTQAVPCIVKSSQSDISAEEDSLAENVQRAPLHPLDQFKAFQALRDRGASEEDIAARFFVTPGVVRQRLRLAAVSPKLLDLFAEDAVTLEQLMAFTVTRDHARQEQVWETLAQSYSKEPFQIRRMLTEGAVRASDKRAQFVGVEAYESAGGVIARDLFEEDDGGWLQDPALLDRLATEKLRSEAEALQAEGWKWIEVAIDFPYGHTTGLRRLAGETVPLTDEEQASCDALRAEYDRLEEQYAEAEELPEQIDQRLGEIETALAAFDQRPVIYDAVDVCRSGAFVSIDRDGSVCIERGYVRREDEAPRNLETGTEELQDKHDKSTAHTVITVAGNASSEPASEEDDGVMRPLSDRLVTELTAHRTLALRDALANATNIAFAGVLHVLCRSAFYPYSPETCLEITAKSSGFYAQAPGLKDSASAVAIAARHESWSKRLPESPEDLWETLLALDEHARMALFAHCASLTVNVVKEPWNRRPGALAHGDQLAQALALDMAAAGWKPTVDNYLGRVPKARILEAVREAKDEASAQLIDHLKKPEMAKEAERLLDGTGWLPESLRVSELARSVSTDASEAEVLPAFLADDNDEQAKSEDTEQQTIAAE